MLHLSFLAHHRKWEHFFENLQTVAVDEVHTYRGVMGSHVAQILRRFHRICQRYGASPTFVFSLLKDTLNAIQGCGCESGCPSCVQSPKCGSGNRPIDKAAAIFILEQLKHQGQPYVDKNHGLHPQKHPASATLGAHKTADGLQALQWWKQGKILEIITYCRQDVKITGDLYRYGIKKGHLLYVNKAQKKLRIPVTW
jgi:ATP-dependent helicase YprA (DUF1998 family)